MSKATTDFHHLVADRQHRRLLRLSFPNKDAPPAQLLVNKLDAFEALSKPFEFRVELLSDDPNIPLKDMQGKMLNVQMVRRDGTLRYFTGRVFSFALKTVDGGVSYYEALLGPWYKYLGMRKDNYLFHYTTMYQQTASIFGDYGSLAEWDWRVAGATEVLTDCCQFDESDRNFLERRWVGNGIAYWFEHSENGHKLVLSDDTTRAEPIDGGPSIRFQRHGGAAEEDGLGEWSPSRQIMQGAVALAAFDFKSPKPVHTSLPTVNQQGDVPAIESYEYTGAYGFTGGGRSLAQLRMEEFEAAGKQFEGSGNNRNVLPGRWFRLTDHFDVSASGGDTQAREFLILEVVHSASNNYHVKDTAESHYENRLRAIRKIIPYRAGRDHNSVETKIHGIQTATVVGPAGEEIHTDEFGRVRVQFHWDRAGTNDEKSSAWLRVATPWAGANFGMTAIPRINGEVLVQFIDGNPNRPIITGMVPNADTMPPWTLPANKTQSGILSRSTPGGSYDNANALRFEDKKGSEQLWLHAEKDQLTEVEHDEDKWVGNDRRKTIDRDETTLVKRDRVETVGRDETITVHNNRAERVDHNEQISIGDNRSEDVGKNEKIDIGGNRTKSVMKNEKDTIGKNWSINVAKAKAKTETIGMAYMQNVGMGRMENVGLGYSLNVGMIMSTIVGVNQSTQVGQKISITAGDELSITVGKSSFIMKADGSVTIKGSKFNFEATGPVQITGKDVDIN
ncbi:type VI secretion system tip protein VgrG [Massilia sp. P8910]|uniref:type VI secretion system Vgr family protein n=1 Tax=Massilia antarctica TaxID=2765360 RepID=UPI001E535A3B|nr:type VI secretion system tip protein TssI/VgrG [Massilia antarctica]MCE3602763.1 type VI secretion system tip protein VgrG [Massilia antarctica]